MFVVKNWGWPQWAFVAIILIGIGLSAAFSGKEKEHSSFGVALTAKIIQTIILVCGSFFQTISWPQVTWIILLAISTGSSYRLSGKKYKESLTVTLVSVVITFFLLIMGGFFA